MRKTLLILMVAATTSATLTGCATVPSYPHDPQAQRYKEGSVYHAYGAALVLTGISQMIVSAVLLGSIAAQPGETPTGAIAATGASFGLGAVFSLVGDAFIRAGNERYTPDPAASIPSQRTPVKGGIRGEETAEEEFNRFWGARVHTGTTAESPSGEPK